MSLAKQDGFSFLKYPNGRMYLSVESGRLEDCIAYCREKRIPYLHISPYHGFAGKDTEFLKECPWVTGVHLQEGGYDLSGLYALGELKQLSAVFELRQALDLGRFSRLEDLFIDWHPKRLLGLYGCKLQRLWLRKYKPQRRDLTELAAVSTMESLQLIQSNIASLAGVERMGRLWELEAHYCSRLRDIGAVAGLKERLLRLRLDHCKNVQNLECVTQLERLTHLSLGGNGSMPSIGFIGRMPGLQFFAFVGTNVLDGDLTPVLGLRYAGFESKRHYSHSFEQVQRMAAESGGRALGPWVWGRNGR